MRKLLTSIILLGCWTLSIAQSEICVDVTLLETNTTVYDIHLKTFDVNSPQSVWDERINTYIKEKKSILSDGDLQIALHFLHKQKRTEIVSVSKSIKKECDMQIEKIECAFRDCLLPYKEFIGRRCILYFAQNAELIGLKFFLNNGRGQQIDFSVCTELFKNIAGMNLISPWDNINIFWSSYMVILPW